MEKQSNEIEKQSLYDDILGQAENKIMHISRNLDVDKFTFLSKERNRIIYYDTPDRLLTTSGILLSKFSENGEYFFKVEKLNFLPTASILYKNSNFIHKIQPKDEPIHHSYYIINGITSIFSTIFTIDLEHILKRVKPIYIIDKESSVYRAFKSNGFKCLISFEKVVYLNKKTKIKKHNNEVEVYFIGLKSLEKDYNEFIFKLEKYSKDIIKKKETRYEFAERTTKIVKQVKPNKTDDKKNKKEQKKKENKIIG